VDSSSLELLVGLFFGLSLDTSLVLMGFMVRYGSGRGGKEWWE
jgi:hypothetical protein